MAKKSTTVVQSGAHIEVKGYMEGWSPPADELARYGGVAHPCSDGVLLVFRSASAARAAFAAMFADGALAVDGLPDPTFRGDDIGPGA